MPEYLAPAVYVEETSFRAKSIEGVSTSTTGFVGPTLTGPAGGPPELITSFADFERIYGGLDELDYGANTRGTNFLAHAVRAYFNEGGSRLYVSRAVPAGASAAQALIVTNEASFVARFKGKAGNGTITVDPALSPATVRSMRAAPLGTVLIGDAGPALLPGTLAAPYNLSGANDTLQLALGTTPENISIKLAVGKAEATVVSPLAAPGAPTQLQVVLNGIQQPGIELKPSMTPQDIVDTINSHLKAGYARLDAGALVIGAYLPSAASRVSVVVKANSALGIANTTGAANVTALTTVSPEELDQALSGAGIRAIATNGKVTLQSTATGTTAQLEWTGAQDPLGLGSSAANGTAGARTFIKKASGWVDAGNAAATGLPSDDNASVGNFVTLTIFTQDGAGRETLYEGVGLDPLHPRWIGSVLSENPTRQSEHLQRLYAIQFADNTPPEGLTLYGSILSSGGRRVFTLQGGSDGAAPSAADYEAALGVLSGIEDISIVAAPGSSAYGDTIAKGVRNALISHAEKRRAYRIAVLDTPPEQGLTQARAWRGEIDSKYAALYYPWVVVPNPLARTGDERIAKELVLPPSGFICGIYARNDAERGVFKAPANEVVRSALRFETDVNFAQQEVLNPLGINCLRFFPGRGYRVWGARTASSDPEWKYVNVRRFFNFLERSIDLGTQWAVFEPNGEKLWRNIRETVSSFLETQWRDGALLGSDTKQAFFVRCDRSTMTQDDLDNGRLICLVGVAVVKPAEFVIFRIGQKTADARN